MCRSSQLSTVIETRHPAPEWRRHQKGPPSLHRPTSLPQHSWQMPVVCAEGCVMRSLLNSDSGQAGQHCNGCSYISLLPVCLPPHYTARLPSFCGSDHSQSSCKAAAMAVNSHLPCTSDPQPQQLCGCPCSKRAMEPLVMPSMQHWIVAVQPLCWLDPQSGIILLPPDVAEPAGCLHSCRGAPQRRTCHPGLLLVGC